MNENFQLPDVHSKIDLTRSQLKVFLEFCFTPMEIITIVLACASKTRKLGQSRKFILEDETLKDAKRKECLDRTDEGIDTLASIISKCLLIIPPNTREQVIHSASELYKVNIQFTEKEHQ